MSLGVGFVLPDGVVLVADGRQVYPLAKDSARTDNDVDKLVPIGQATFAIPFGIAQATDEALNILQRSLGSGLSPERVAELVDFSTAAGWASFATHLARDVDPCHRSMRAALIVGGLAERVPFVTAALHGPGIKQKPLLLKECSLQFILLGGEDFSASKFFADQAGRLLSSVVWDSATGPLNPTVMAVLEASGNTIRHIESCDSTVGGTRRYVVIRAGFPIEKAVL